MLHAKAPLAAACFSSLLLSACAHYTRLPLDTHAHYAPSVAALHGAPAQAAPLDEADVVRLVLQNNPSLQTSALRTQEARMQGDAAARPPNPSFAGSLGYLISGAGNATAWTAALSQPVNGWITLRARRDEARASVAEVDATLAWEAWQAVAKARQLYASILLNETLQAVQIDTAAILQRQAQAMQAALARGDVDMASVAPIALATSEATLARDETGRTLLAQQRELHALLGLSSSAPLELGPLPTLAPLDAAAMAQAIDDLPRHRPDLVALAMGYDAQDARFRAAVLSQFPALTLGYDASQDNSKVRNGGPAASIDLPVFDTGRAGAAASEATRQRLHDEYAARIADATDEAAALLRANHADASPEAADTSQPSAPTTTAFSLNDPSTPAARALARGDIDRAAYTDLAIASLARRAAVVRTELALREQRIGLEALLGIGMPAFDIDTKVH
ncbi:TolC family protein [Bacillus sp. NP157]|nr:TolC family protein [Bacillus sp. NP157]